MKIQQTIISKLEYMSKKKVTLDSTLEQLNVDSLDLADLIIEAEKEFQIQIPDEELTKIKKVKDIVILVEKLKSNI
ncbi:phosphopantetheine-binding protein [Mycoplasmopsis alligatoris]|uniref:Putative acyl carrier protein n=1 Tax=Mycoplasmopsis alligatoris A21JP2 TaxID=747682 RepID=D4XWS9_9BACT|nr:phosphopantetheine-binding protein [Mycoplasmopsis alligatoris]EFF41158.1 putative acyl carrier protein [Mycoplasmopsis alligatoris A21JP2]